MQRGAKKSTARNSSQADVADVAVCCVTTVNRKVRTETSGQSQPGPGPWGRGLEWAILPHRPVVGCNFYDTARWWWVGLRPWGSGMAHGKGPLTAHSALQYIEPNLDMYNISEGFYFIN
jgi:hypothetical protein